MIIEGLLTTEDDQGRPHVAPMGPVVDEPLENWLLRPFQTSTTFKLLRKQPLACFHVTDDVLPVVQAALGISVDLEFERHNSGRWIIPSACHWYGLRVTEWDLSNPRSEAKAAVETRGAIRPCWGWNRAKHAVLEATILMTRLHLLKLEDVRDEFARLQTAVEKTSGPREQAAWALLCERLESSSDDRPPATAVATVREGSEE